MNTPPMSPRPRITVNVALCGAIPRSEFGIMPFSKEKQQQPHSRLQMARNSFPLRQTLSEMTSFELKTIVTQDRNNGNTPDSTVTFDGSTTGYDSVQNVSGHPLRTIANSNTDRLNMPSNTPWSSKLSDKEASPPTIIDPPRWAVPAKGESVLEPVCEARGTHRPVDLTKRNFYRVGRSPSSDIQLFHGTSSRKHALIFHHENGSCYVVDIGSAHGTYVNGVRVQSVVLTSGMVVPHRVRRGALIRFGGPGAPSFVLKSFAVGLKEMVERFEEPSCNPTLSPRAPQSNRPESEIVLVNTRLNAIGRQGVSSKRKFVEEPHIPGGILKKKAFVEDGECNRLSKRRRRVSFPTEPAQPFYPASVTPDHSLSEDEDNV